jgi:hypothetical protein
VTHLDQNALDLVQADGTVGAVIELGRVQRLMVRNLLRMFDCTAILQIGSNSGSPERMAAGRLGQSRLSGDADRS